MVKPMKLGLVVGGFISLLHLIWALAIAIMPVAMQRFLDWIFGLHFLQPVYVLTPATWGKAIILVLLTFIVGWIVGNILGMIRNAVHKK